MSTWKRCLLGLLFAALIVFATLAMLRTGIYGYTMFIVAPIMFGGLASWVFRPSSGWSAASYGAVAASAGTFFLFVLGLEGMVCVVMTLPLASPLGAFGGWLAYHADASSDRGIAAMMLLPPAAFLWDIRAQPATFEVRSRIEIAAAPEQVWPHIIAFPELPEHREWYFHTGLAYPRRARIEGTGVGATRYCEFSTGAFVEPIEVWDKPSLLRFQVSENPAPMREWSPYGQIAPKHLQGYLISRQGQFQLTPLANGHTLLEGTTWYQHGLWPEAYWRWWSDAIIHRIHLRVLNHIRQLTERENSVSW